MCGLELTSSANSSKNILYVSKSFSGTNLLSFQSFLAAIRPLKTTFACLESPGSCFK